ncbi:MAG: hypothetical protein H7235_10000 [Bdellovibrionaceae bacterium]|nr:hypothetical protein [Pseudobdellovibrionaceae bacterium]
MPASANHIPLDKSSGTDYELVSRLFYIQKDWSLLGEFTGINQFENQNFRSLTLGAYYRFHPNLRMGLFYKRQLGFRHNEDWITDPILDWKWQNTNARGEDLAIFDVSPKFLIPFFPGDAWSLELKTRIEYNSFNQNQNLRFRPMLTYYWIREDKPFINFFIEQEQALPLNYGQGKVNELWNYVGALYNQSEQFQFGVNVSQKTMTWVNTDDFQKSLGSTYSTANTGTTVGLLVIYKFEK